LALTVSRNTPEFTNHPLVRPDTNCDHVFRYLLAETHSCIKTLGDDIGQAIVDDDLEPRCPDIPSRAWPALARGQYWLRVRWR
jgi:hypothetical protein